MGELLSKTISEGLSSGFSRRQNYEKSKSIETHICQFASQRRRKPCHVKGQLGRSGIKTIVDIYGHRFQSKSETGVNRLDTVAPACTLSAPNQGKSGLSV